MSVLVSWYLALVFLILYPRGLDRDDRRYHMNIIKRFDSYVWFDEQLAFAALLLLQFVRVFYVMRASRTFGPMLQIISKMLAQVAVFGVILAVVIIIYASAGRVIFNGMAEFDDNLTTYGLLFEALLGGIDLSLYNSEQVPVHKIVGYAYIISFCIIASITLFNFLIAILTYVYDYYKETSIGLHLRYVITVRQSQRNDNKYSWLVTTVPPLNIFSFPFVPLIYYLKNKMANKVMIIWSYTDVFTFGWVSFFVCSILLIPFSYIVTLINLIWRSFRPKLKPKYRCLAILDIFIHLFFGVIIYLYQIVVDTVKFAAGLYDENLMLKADIIHNSEIKKLSKSVKLDPEFFILFIELLKQSKHKVVSAKKFITKDLSDALLVPDQMYELLFQCSRKGYNNEEE